MLGLKLNHVSKRGPWNESGEVGDESVEVEDESVEDEDEYIDTRETTVIMLWWANEIMWSKSKSI